MKPWVFRKVPLLVLVGMLSAISIAGAGGEPPQEGGGDGGGGGGGQPTPVPGNQCYSMGGQATDFQFDLTPSGNLVSLSYYLPATHSGTTWNLQQRLVAYGWDGEKTLDTGWYDPTDNVGIWAGGGQSNTSFPGSIDTSGGLFYEAAFESDTFEFYDAYGQIVDQDPNQPGCD